MAAADVTTTESENLTWSAATIRMALVGGLVILLSARVHLEFAVDQHSPHLVGSGVQNTMIGVVDLLFVLIIIAILPLLGARKTYFGAPLGQTAVAVFVPIVAIGLVIHPTLEGSVMLLRVLGMFAVIIAIRSMSRTEFLMGVILPLSVGASLQALGALLQTLVLDTGIVVPATELAQGRAWTGGLGTFSGSYALAAYLVLAMSVLLSLGITTKPSNSAFASVSLSNPARIMMWGTVVISSAAIATTFGRAALLAAGSVGAVYSIGWIVRRHRIFAISAIASLAPLAVTGVVLRSGWLVRASQSANLDFTTRDVLAAHAIEMIRSRPITGIGPVQYGPNLARMGLDVIDLHVVHNLPLLISAEFGIIVGVAFAIWLVVMGIRAFRLSVYATAIFVSILPLILFDNLHYVYANGLAMFAIWIAVLDYHSDAGAARVQDDTGALPAEQSQTL